MVEIDKLDKQDIASSILLVSYVGISSIGISVDDRLIIQFELGPGLTVYLTALWSTTFHRFLDDIWAIMLCVLDKGCELYKKYIYVYKKYIYVLEVPSIWNKAKQVFKKEELKKSVAGENDRKAINKGNGSAGQKEQKKLGADDEAIKKKDGSAEQKEQEELCADDKAIKKEDGSADQKKVHGDNKASKKEDGSAELKELKSGCWSSK
ncbi:hypothetical protein OWV82_022820 [Melia azedarach]|uniref:Uncharacterized protein n=1 Tax=Melia azedarach TaxID=155640 RepID=A0ACC1WUU0_MELAZ|nr:hypothetical protein OWV82_022820 [Melia azedarach]